MLHKIPNEKASGFGRAQPSMESDSSSVNMGTQGWRATAALRGVNAGVGQSGLGEAHYRQQRSWRHCNYHTHRWHLDNGKQIQGENTTREKNQIWTFLSSQLLPADKNSNLAPQTYCMLHLLVRKTDLKKETSAIIITILWYGLNMDISSFVIALQILKR